jgi:MFS family permease
MTESSPPSADRNPAPRWRELVGDGRLRVTVGLMVVEAVAGLEDLIVTTTMPATLRDLGGIAFYGWVFSGYSLAALVAIPRTGNAADRHGAGRPFTTSMAIFALGTLLCGLAPTMPMLALARVVQGYGSAGAYTVGYGAITHLYPERLRPRMLALLSFVWVGSALTGPPLGAGLASALSWRLSFLVMLPVIALSFALAGPALRRAAAHDDTGLVGVSLRWPLQLAAGGGAVLAALSSPQWLLAPVGVAGLLLAIQALVHVMPAGTFRVATGLPAAVVVGFLLNIGIFGADSYVPLMLTGVRGLSVLQAGILVTLGTVAWCAGTWVQVRIVERVSAATLVLVSSGVLTAAVAGTALGLIGLPLPLVYVSWCIAGLSTGVAFPTALLAAMEATTSGREHTAMAARFIGGRLGIALGAGLGGASVAVATGAGASLAAGLAGCFAVAVVAGAMTMAASLRLPRRRP